MRIFTIASLVLFITQIFAPRKSLGTYMKVVTKEKTKGNEIMQ